MLHMPSPMLMVGASEPVGQQLFLAGTSWVVPAGVTSVCVVTIGRGCEYSEYTGPGGGGYAGAGGGLAYVNNIAVTPGETLIVSVDNGSSSLSRGGTRLCGASAAEWREEASPRLGQPLIGTGFAGGGGRYYGANQYANGAGAGGYTSAGADATQAVTSAGRRGGGGSSPYGGGAGGNSGVAPAFDGANYGGGGASQFGAGGAGCVRIIWGPARAFPNTRTGDIT